MPRQIKPITVAGETIPQTAAESGMIGKTGSYLEGTSVAAEVGPIEKFNQARKDQLDKILRRSGEQAGEVRTVTSVTGAKIKERPATSAVPPPGAGMNAERLAEADVTPGPTTNRGAVTDQIMGEEQARLGQQRLNEPFRAEGPASSTVPREATGLENLDKYGRVQIREIRDGLTPEAYSQLASKTMRDTIISVQDETLGVNAGALKKIR